jgi:Carboxypeptidase regulatory-like domain
MAVPQDGGDAINEPVRTGLVGRAVGLAQPKHRLTVKVVEQDTATPVENAQVWLGPYRAATGASGVAELALPKGSYDINVWKSGYEAPTTAITVDADLAVDIVIMPAPDENPDDLWQM